MSIKNYLSYIFLIFFCIYLLILTLKTYSVTDLQISKETLAKVAPVSVKIDTEFILNLVPANE